MTKQEEIKGMMQHKIELGVGFGLTPEEVTSEVWGYLHSQGVVIKVGEGLPVTDELVSWSDVANAGYVAVESLIKE